MKKTYLIKDFLYSLVWCLIFIAAPLYFITRYPGKIEGWIIAIAFIILFFQVIWVKIVFRDNYVIFVNGFIRRRVNYRDIHKLRITDYKPKFARGTVPAILLTSNTLKPFPIYFRRFREKDIISIIEHLKSENNQIKLCHTITLLMNNEESVLMQRIKKNEKWQIIILLGSIALTIIVYMIMKKS